MKKIHNIIITILLLIIIGGIYKFIFQGSTSKSSDGRLAIHLTESERNLVLEEMRAFLVSVQQIITGISENNMPLVVKYAKKVGKAAQAEVPGTLMGKLPLSFKKLGFDTHTKFDELALDASSLEDKSHSLKQLKILMQNCVSCHAAYRLDLEKE